MLLKVNKQRLQLSFPFRVNDEPFFKTNSVVQYTIFIFIASLLTSSRTFFENIFNTVN